MVHTDSTIRPKLLDRPARRTVAQVGVTRAVAEVSAVDACEPGAVDEIARLVRSAVGCAPSDAGDGVRQQNLMQARLTAPATDASLFLAGNKHQNITSYRWNATIGGASIYGDRAGIGAEHASGTRRHADIIGGGLAHGHMVEVHGGHATRDGGTFWQVVTNGSEWDVGAVHQATIFKGMSVVGGGDLMVSAESDLRVLRDCGAWVLMEQTRKRAWAPTFMAAASQGLLGFGLNGGVIFTGCVGRRAWLRRDEAAQVLARKHRGTTARWLRRMEAVGLRRPAMRNLEQNEPLSSVGVGDRASWSQQRMDTGGASVAVAGGMLGLWGSIARDKQIVMERTAERTMRVTVAPCARTTSTALSVNIPILGEMHIIWVHGGQERETYTLDVGPSDESLSCEAFADKLLHSDTMPLSAFSEHQNIHWQTSRGGGVPAPSYIPFVNMAGLSQELRVAEVVTDLQSPSNMVRVWQLTRTRESQWWRHGTRQQHVFATLRQQRSRSTQPWAFVDLTLGAAFHYDRYTPYWQPRLVRKLNRQFFGGPQLQTRAFTGNAPYKLSMQRTLTARDLDTLANMPQHTIDAVAQATFANAVALHTMVQHLAYHTHIPLSPVVIEAQANVLRNYLGKVGLPGLGAVHLLLGGDLSAWKIDVEHGAVTHIAQHAGEIAIKYAAASFSDAAMREKARCRAKIDDARRRIASDPILAMFPAQAAAQERVLQRTGDALSSTPMCFRKPA